MENLSHIVGQIQTSDLGSLAQHRHRKNWEAALESTEFCFLRAPFSKNNLELFGKLPCLKRWRLGDQGRLTLLGKTLPNKILHTLSWQDLSTLLPLVPAKGRNSEEFFGHIPLILTSSDSIRESTALLIESEQFLSWANDAAAPRLSRLKFALSSNKKVLINGTPLPSLAGQSFYPQGQLLLPSGFALPEHLFHEHISAALKLRSDQFALIHTNEIDILDTEQFIPATRAAVRLSINTKS